MSNISAAIRYWAQATIRPRAAFTSLRGDPGKVAVAFWINLLFAAMYTITVVVYFRIGRLPAIEPWVPVPADRNYLYQAFWTIPWGLATWIMISGAAHLLAIAGPQQRHGYQFEDALVVCGLAWIVPNLFCMWIPETLLVPFGIDWPEWLELLRLAVIAPLWQIALVAVGLRVTHEIGWLRAISIGIVTVALFVAMFLAFMR
jgi:hypothetical protein